MKSLRETWFKPFGVTEDQMQKAAEILGKDKNSKKSGNSSFWLVKGYGPENYNNSAKITEKEVLFIQSGNTKSSMFKIKVNNHVFSLLFDTGPQVSCIKYDTVATLGWRTK